MFAFETFKLK